MSNANEEFHDNYKKAKEFIRLGAIHEVELSDGALSQMAQYLPVIVINKISEFGERLIAIQESKNKIFDKYYGRQDISQLLHTS